jgi:hypothetical protein
MSARLEHVGEVRYVKGIHGGLPNIPGVYEDVFRWLNEEPMELPSDPSDALSRHLAAAAASEAPHLDGTVREAGPGDDPGYWHLDDQDLSRLGELEARLEEEMLPSFNRVRLF